MAENRCGVTHQAPEPMLQLAEAVAQGEEHGCGNVPCSLVARRLGGQHTNGACHCLDGVRPMKRVAVRAIVRAAVAVLGLSGERRWIPVAMLRDILEDLRFAANQHNAEYSDGRAWRAVNERIAYLEEAIGEDPQ